jgi:hypothetical protein
MKHVLALVLATLSLPTLAFINEVECEFRDSSQIIAVDVERPFPSNSVFKRMLVTVQNNNGQSTYNYSVTTRRFGGFNEIQYFAGGVRLTVDLWPDNIPRWGRYYRGTFQSMELGNQTLSGLDCRFPNAQ